MPELPEVETVRCGLAPAMENARFVAVETRRRDLRCPLPDRFAERLEGHAVRALRRRAKYLLADLSSDDILVMHLGMSGSFRVEQDDFRTNPGVFHFDRSQDRAHDHVVFRMSSGARIIYNDPRRFGLMLLLTPNQLAAHSLMSGIGPEPLENGFNAGVLASACQGRKTSLKAALLDQKVVAGLGNIYVCEALHRAGLSPKRKASCLATRGGGPTPSAERLVAAIRAVLRDAIRQGGSSLRDHRQTDGGLGYFQHHFRVYDREDDVCTTNGCSCRIVRIVQQGRSTFYCPKCQR